jgi:hypothetical protein
VPIRYGPALVAYYLAPVAYHPAPNAYSGVGLPGDKQTAQITSVGGLTSAHFNSRQAVVNGGFEPIG